MGNPLSDLGILVVFLTNSVLVLSSNTFSSQSCVSSPKGLYLSWTGRTSPVCNMNHDQNTSESLTRKPLQSDQLADIDDKECDSLVMEADTVTAPESQTISRDSEEVPPETSQEGNKPPSPPPELEEEGDNPYTPPPDPEEEGRYPPSDMMSWSTLEEFGYSFNKDGCLRDRKTDGPFEFNAFQDHSSNQKRYELLGNVITEYVYGLLEGEGKLERIEVPVDAKKKEGTSFFFMSRNIKDCDKLLILIHGSGAVRAGQWARRLIINHSLDSGTQLPYIREAHKLGYGVVVLNTNNNYNEITYQSVRANETPTAHASYVWDHFIEKLEVKYVDVVAHSYGGAVTTDLAKKSSFREKVRKIAFTDSVHSFGAFGPSKVVVNFLIKSSINWVTSGKPLGTSLSDGMGDVQRRSAGTGKHEETSWKAFEEVFKWFKKGGKELEKKENKKKKK